MQVLDLNGYGFYVWGSYAVAAIAIALEIALVAGRVRAAQRLALHQRQSPPAR